MTAPTLKVHADFVTMTFMLPATMARRTKGGDLEETPGKTPGKRWGKHQISSCSGHWEVIE
jgi:hypothetical protein